MEAAQKKGNNIAEGATTTAPKEGHPDARDYYAPLTEQEKEDISYIITTLANKSTITLMFYKRPLNRAGDRVAHVHPLVFLGFIFSDPELKDAVIRIKGYPWRRYAQGMAGSLESAAMRDNMHEEFIDDFANTVGIDKSLIYPSIQNEEWEQFINIVRDNLPTENRE